MIEGLKNIVKAILASLMKLRWVRKIRYSEIGWKIYLIFLPKIKRATDEELDLYQKLTKGKRRNLAFDVGANRGINTSQLLQLGFKVVAIEPEARNFEALSFRFSGTGRVVLFHGAVSNQNGVQELKVEEGDSLHTLSSKWEKTAGAHLKTDVEYYAKQSVQCWTLDELIDRCGLPDFLKVDVEGHELAVFEGLTKVIPLIIFEANLPIFSEETKQIIAKLSSLSENYVFEIYKNGRISALTMDMLDEITNSSSVEIICRID